MTYLTLLVSDLPVMPKETDAQKIYMRIEKSVPNEFLNLSAADVKTYFDSVVEVIEQDLIKSTPPPASPPEESSPG